MSAKLTEAQRRVLRQTASPNGLRKSEALGEDWRRIDSLLERGLCELRTFDSYVYRITDAGRAALSEASR